MENYNNLTTYNQKSEYFKLGYRFKTQIFNNEFKKYFNGNQDMNLLTHILKRYQNSIKIKLIKNKDGKKYVMYFLKDVLNAFYKFKYIDNQPTKEDYEEIEHQLNKDNSKKYYNDNSYENDMQAYSNYLINNQYQYENNKNYHNGKIIYINESQYKYLKENFDIEGFNFSNANRKMIYNPHNNNAADTTIFKNNSNEFNVKRVLLPKSQTISYNLYSIRNMNVNKGLKHGKNVNGEDMDITDQSIATFIRRTVIYIKALLGNQEVDVITYPQSSSNFNNLITSQLRAKYPNSEGIKLIPELLTKNVRNIFVNVDFAKELGLTDNEIYSLQHSVELWKTDEDIRDVRRKLDALKKEISQIIQNRGKGRPNKEFTNKVKQADLYNQEIKQLRKGRVGRDSTMDKNQEVKDFQMKSLDDKYRRAIEGLFEINPQYYNLQYKFKGKHIVIFDDNISSGATLDDVCLALKKLGVASITPITLGIIPPTIYKPSERSQSRH